MIESLLENSYYVITLLILLSLAIGSFLTMFVYRFPRMLFARWQKECHTFLKEHQTIPSLPNPFNLAFPHSHCPHCQTPLKWFHNVPLLGFMLQKGHCTHCGKSISLDYPLIELLAVLLPLLCYLQFHQSIAFLAATLFSWCLLAQSYIDAKHHMIPDELTLPMVWFGLLINLHHTFTDIQSAIIGAIVGYIVLWLFAKLFYLIRKKEGMGYGDFKLFAMFGAWMGWQSLPFILLLSSFLGAVVGCCLILFKKRRHDVPFAFGPYLALAAWLNLVYGTNPLGV